MLIRVRDTGAVMYEDEFRTYMSQTTGASWNQTTDAILNELGADPVLNGPYPTCGTYQYVNGGPVVLIDGQWFTSFVVVDMDEEQIGAKNVELAANNKAKGQQILSDTDWTAIPSVADPLQSNPYLTNQDAFFVYRSAVRDIVLNPTYDAVFPEEPVEAWSNV
jgi:hypothetical protein